MKYFVLALAIAAGSLFTIVSTNDALADGVKCSDQHINVSRYNPTELSDYQKCVLDQHEEKNAGILGSIAWVRLADGSYVSTQVRYLVNQSNGNAAKAAEVMTQVVVKEVAAELDSVETMLRDLGVSEKKIANKLDKMIVKKLRGDNYKINPKDRSHNFYAGKRYNDDTFIHASPFAHKDANGNVNHANTINTLIQGNTLGGSLTHNGYVQKVLTDSTNPWWAEFQLELNEYIAQQISAAYKEGYNDGYRDGYRDGYADGFKDGVASVSK